MPANDSPNRALAEIKELIDAGRPLIYLKSSEEERVQQLLIDAGQQLFSTPVPVYTWTVTEGLRGPDGASVGEATVNPRVTLDWIVDHEGAALFNLRDFHDPMQHSAEVRRRLRDLCTACFDKGKFSFVSSPVAYIPDELQRDIVLIDLPLPDFEELRAFLQREGESLAASGVTVDSDPGTLTQLGRAVQGLTLNETRHALRRAVVSTRRLDSSSVPYLLEEKHLLVKKKTGVIEYVTDAGGLENVGGAPVLKKWLLERRKLFEMRDQLSHDIVPKGLLMMGISGCGKSLAVKAIAQCFGLPLYRIDMIEVFSGRHGNPEGTFVGACRTMEEMAPAVMWFDEIEMGISARANDAAGSLGRIFAFFLTWMQEKTRGLFVAATANRIDLLPAEMIRKGRFDEVFFVDLPNEEERLDICKIHLLKRGIDPAPLGIDRLKQFTRGWTGAEIEQCIVSALTTAKLENRELIGDDLLNQTAKIVPLSKTMKEQVEHIRSWALDRALRTAPRTQGGQ
jgi:ATPase family protein associated with various cellular activities (AAA)